MAIPARRRDLIPYLLLLIALAATASTARYAYVSGWRQDQLRFDNVADRVGTSIASRLDAYVAMLLGGAGLFAASEDVGRDEFRSYVIRLELPERYRGIQGIGFSRVIAPEDREAVLAEMRRDLPSFRFWPDQPGRPINAIVYLEPPDERNVLAFGYDMGADPTRAEAMSRARDLGRPAASGKVRLVQEGTDERPGQAGFLIYVPVYRGGSVPVSMEQRRRALLGFVYSPFRADDLLVGITDSAELLTVDLDVYDGPPSDDRLLHRSQRVPERRFTAVRSFPVAGRTWTIVLHGGDEMRVSASRTVLALVVFSGLALSGFLFVITRGQVRGRIAAEVTADELRRSEEQLRQADRAKDEFLATVSHELRTPLNAIVGWASMLSRGAVPPGMHAHGIAVIARNAAAQTRLVEDLLDMSRAVAGHLQLRIADVDPRVVLQAAVEALRPAVDEAGLTLEYEAGENLCHIQADAGRLQQIVNNLLSNSLKFTPRGGRVSLRADCVGGSFVLTVDDTGIGMEPGFVPFVFDRFRQANSSSTRLHPGAGLGLAIARHLVHLHGGAIEAHSEGIGRGSRFTVRLPIAGGRRTASLRPGAESFSSSAGQSQPQSRHS